MGMRPLGLSAHVLLDSSWLLQFGDPDCSDSRIIFVELRPSTMGIFFLLVTSEGP